MYTYYEDLIEVQFDCGCKLYLFITGRYDEMYTYGCEFETIERDSFEPCKKHKNLSDDEIYEQFYIPAKEAVLDYGAEKIGERIIQHKYKYKYANGKLIPMEPKFYLIVDETRGNGSWIENIVGVFELDEVMKYVSRRCNEFQRDDDLEITYDPDELERDLENLEFNDAIFVRVPHTDDFIVITKVRSGEEVFNELD